MSTVGTNPPGDKRKVSEFKIKIKKIEDNFNHNLLSIPNELKMMTLDNTSDLSTLFYHIGLQTYKLQQLSAGELVPLTSNITIKKALGLYATKDDKGNLQLLIQDNAHDKFYRIDDIPSVNQWRPSNGLMIRINNLHSKPPAHFLKYINQQKLQSCLSELSKNRHLIDKLTPNTHIVIQTADKINIQVRRTQSGDYLALIETKNPQEPFLRIDSKQKSIWEPYHDMLMDEQSISFLKNIEKTLADLKPNKLPKQLNGLIKYEQLISIYKYILNNPLVVTKLINGHSFRIPKEFAGLARTLNIVRDIDGEFMLMLETKRKLVTGHKDAKKLIGIGSYGTVKPAWRIDTSIPEEWVNKTVKDDYVSESDYEALFSQRLIQHRSTKSEALNVTLLGELFFNKNIAKRSQYSKRAIGDLDQVLANASINLTENDKKRIIQNILEGISVMHSQGKIHQDLKVENILIYKEDKGYYAKVADFGISTDPNSAVEKPALATLWYESPEIQLAYEDPVSDYHAYFNSSNNSLLSLAFNIFNKIPARNPYSDEAISYRKAHFANDIWAAGIVIFKLLYGYFPRHNVPGDQDKINSNPLLHGLLNPSRDKRINIQQALELHNPIVHQVDAAPLLPNPKQARPAPVFANHALPAIANKTSPTKPSRPLPKPPEKVIVPMIASKPLVDKSQPVKAHAQITKAQEIAQEAKKAFASKPKQIIKTENIPKNANHAQINQAKDLRVKSQVSGLTQAIATNKEIKPRPFVEREYQQTYHHLEMNWDCKSNNTISDDLLHDKTITKMKGKGILLTIEIENWLKNHHEKTKLSSKQTR